jgi:predicted nuclease of predicted toxin-antitoxin system
LSDLKSLQELGLLHAKDLEIWRYAKENDYTILTQDSDFNDLMISLGFPPKIIWLRTGNRNSESIFQLLIKYKMRIINFIETDNQHGCLEIFG